MRKTIYKLALLVAVLFVFLAPVVPTSVTRFWLLPWRNQCFGGIPSSSDPQFQPVSVYASISYVGFEVLFDGTGRMNHGLFGLVIVPNNGWNTVQFPPVGYGTVMCL